MTTDPIPVVVEAPRRIRRTRKYGGWRARIASFLRWLSDIVNPLAG